MCRTRLKTPTAHPSIPAIENAKTTAKEAEAAESAASGQEETTGLSGLLSKVTDGISKAAAETVGRFKQVLNNLIEALAVMLVTSCLIPILVILFFLWLVKLITGRQHPAAGARQRRKSPSADVS